MLRTFLVAIFCSLLSASVWAEPISASEQAEFQRIITAQITAFKADDGDTAYKFAAPIVQKIFPSVETFMNMVRKGYPQVYRPQSYKFTEALLDPVGRPTQRVTIVGPDGKTYEALYSMEKQPDGSWLISGCTIVQIPGLDA
jgi:hypothetical protein